MKNYLSVALFALTALIISCQESDVAQLNHETTRKLIKITGTWRLIESAYSVGSGLIIDTIPAVPPQTLSFSVDNSVVVTGEYLSGWESIQAYSLFTDSLGVDHIRIWVKDPDAEYHYDARITLSSDTLRITPYCFEGCYSLFVRVKQ